VSDDAPSWRDATRVVRAGLAAPVPGAPYLAGPTFAAPFHAPGDPATAPYSYGRFDNPTWSAYETALAELEGGPAVLFASGMAATMAVLGSVLRPGDRLVMQNDCYYTTRVLARERLAPLGVEVVFARVDGDCVDVPLTGARLLWLESPGNPGLDVCDLAALAQAVHAAGALVAVDNTTATPLAQRPLALGADFSVCSDTKAMTGHADLVLGHVAVRDAAWHDALRGWRRQTGAIPGPMEVWLAHRSLGTLAVRLERQSASALAIATLLASHPAVRSVRYPGLSSDPAHALAARQMAHFGPVLSFELADRAAAERFFATSRLVHEATSFGGIHTSAERRARWGGDAVGEGFVRMSVGLEDVGDLVADVRQALGRGEPKTGRRGTEDWGLETGAGGA
jgi:cystathionine gamma-lyase